MMEKRRKGTLISALVCLCMLLVMAAGAAVRAETVYTRIAYAESGISVSSILSDPTGDLRTWEISKLANSGRGDMVFQWGWTVNPSTDEWVQIDLGEEKNVGKVALHNEAKNGIPGEFALWSSKDGSSWTELDRYRTASTDWQTESGAYEYAVEFEPVATRYLKVRIYEKGLADGAWLVKLSNIEVYESDQPAREAVYLTEQECSITVSGSLDSAHDKAALQDGQAADNSAGNTPFWSGDWQNGAKTDSDWLVFDAGEELTLGMVSLFPRVTTSDNSVPGHVYGFPTAFHFEYSTDGQLWKSVKDAAYTEYEANLSWNDFAFSRPVTARYIRLTVTERGLDGSSYLTQFSEAKLYRSSYVAPPLAYEKLTATSATASGSFTDSEGPEKAIDGRSDTRWTAPWGFAEHKFSDEWIMLDLGSDQIVGKVSLLVGANRQPKALRILGSRDGAAWSVLYDDRACAYEGSGLEAVFDSQLLRYVRVEIFEKGMDGANYLSALNEIEVYGTNESEPAVEPVTYSQIAPMGAAVSSEFGGNGAEKLFDGVTANKTASSNHWMTTPSDAAAVDGSGSPVGFDGFYYVLGESAVSVDRLSLFPRFDGQPGAAIGFPENFRIVYSLDGQIWYQVPGAEYTDYQVQAGWNDFFFAERVSAKYLGVMVEKRGRDGELYTIELSEARAFQSSEQRAAAQPGQPVLDASTLTVQDFTPALTYYTHEQFRLKLSECFTYSLDAELEFHAGEYGEIVEDMGERYYVFTPTAKGEYAIEISCNPVGKPQKTAKLTFTLTAVSKEDPDVILLPFEAAEEYAVGVTFRVELSRLFLYEGTAKLVYSASAGEIVTENGVDYLICRAETAGEVEIKVTAHPEGRPEKAAEAAFTLTVVEIPFTVQPQPPIYGRDSSGCASASAGASLLALGFVLFGAIKRAIR